MSDYVGKAKQLYDKYLRNGGSAGLSQKIKNDPRLVHSRPLPTDVEHGMAKQSTSNSFASTNYLDYPDGIICENCLCQTFTLNLSQDEQQLHCPNCTRSSIHRPSKPIPDENAFKKQKVPVTNLPINHFAFVARSSRGQKVELENFANLHKFCREYLSFPYRETHLQHFVDYFGGNGNGLANIDAMHRTITSDSQGNKMQPLTQIVNRFQAVHRPGLDKVTIVCYQISSLSVKLSNLVKLVRDFEKVHIPKEDFTIAVYGSISENNKTLPNPYCISGCDILKMFDEKQMNPLLSSMEIG